MNINEFENMMKELYVKKADYFKSTWNRVLPFGDMLTDRWGKAKLLNFGDKTSIYDNSLVFGDVTVGENTWIGPFTILDGSAGKLTIGTYCCISSGVQIYTHDSIAHYVTGGKAGFKKKSTSIGDCTYLGPFSVVTRGVNIGKHCIIGAFSLVNKDIPDYSVAWGQPASVMGNIEIDENGNVNINYYK